MLRGCTDFDRLEDYRAFIAEIVSRHNARNHQRIEAERAVLQPLPAHRRAQDFEIERVRVTPHCGFTVRKVVFYSVPLAPESAGSPPEMLREWSPP